MHARYRVRACARVVCWRVLVFTRVLVACAQKLHDAVVDPANGYEGSESLLLHPPEQVRNLLDLD